MQGISKNDSEESLELAQFRREWLAELNKRKAGPSTTAPLDSISSPLFSTQVVAVQPSIAEASLPTRRLSTRNQNHSTPLTPNLQAALDVYRRAVEHEQHGELDDAMHLYRQAFRIDSRIDRIYHREEMIASVVTAQRQPLRKENVATDTLAHKLKESVHLDPVASRIKISTGTLARLLEGFPSEVTLEPDIQNEPVHLRKLPDELLVMILRKLDPTNVERFALVNRKCRILALDPSIWRVFVSAIYKPPQVEDVESMVPVVGRYLFDYRRVFIEHPRIRLDGVYIATCHYVRPGLSENSWVNLSHLITYHRYLRFLSNGQVLSLLTNEEHTPQQIIPMLKPSLRMKGFFIGTWQLSGTTVRLDNLLDASGRFSLPAESSTPPHDHHHRSGHTSDPTPGERTRYMFTMSLQLFSRPLGRWNRLNIESYQSVNFETGSTNPVALKHERPFWFSKVRSYPLF